MRPRCGSDVRHCHAGLVLKGCDLPLFSAISMEVKVETTSLPPRILEIQSYPFPGKNLLDFCDLRSGLFLIRAGNSSLLYLYSFFWYCVHIYLYAVFQFGIFPAGNARYFLALLTWFPVWTLENPKIFTFLYQRYLLSAWHWFFINMLMGRYITFWPI